MIIDDQWRPKGVEDLEPAAWDAIKHPGHSCVVAGPGAGKTEFLAQKVAYLLEQEHCAEPRRILAISFKKDAADNIRARVQERCEQKYSRRFDSMTFDALAKSIVDRFRLSLPKSWRPKPGYDIVNFKEQQYGEFLANMRDSNLKYASKIESIKPFQFRNELLGTHKLSEGKPATLVEYLCQQWIATKFGGNIDFLIVNRLADYILRSNRQIGRALALTYPVIALDEFQDTTYAQYDFLSTLLGITSANAIVVGDNKQRIMSWAGAKPDSFEKFALTYSAQKFELQMNYRSSPALVQIHHALARSIDTTYKPAHSKVHPKIDSGFAEIWNFCDPQIECGYLADWIRRDMSVRALLPADYAILVRQKPDEMYEALSEEFLKRDLLVCNESRRFGKLSLQDIVSDELFVFFASLLRVVIQKRSAAAWTRVSKCFDFFFPTDVDELNPKASELLDKLAQKNLRPFFHSFTEPKESIERSFENIIQIVGEGTIRGAFPQHHSQVNFEMFLESVGEFFHMCARDSKSWTEFIDRVDRVNQIPLLTVHKSKGLEYDTVLFLRLDDSAWWSYSSRNPEGKATFFVGLSRAKQRVIFTYASGGRSKISEIYSLLADAGVPEKYIN